MFSYSINTLPGKAEEYDRGRDHHIGRNSAIGQPAYGAL